MTWTQGQQIALAVMPKFSSILSLFGSSWIIVEVLFDEDQKGRKRRNVYSRLLLAMSVYDVLESVWNFASTWPIPEGTEGIYGAVGTTQTCTTQGFFLQLGLAVPIYNASLSLYYLMVIKYSVTDALLRRKLEPSMHAIAFLFPFATSLACVLLDQFNNANLWCWIAPYPSGCLDEGNCERGDHAGIFRWAFYFGPLWFCILFALVSMIIVYFAVHELDSKTLKYRKPSIRFAVQTETIDPANEPSAGGSTTEPETVDGRMGKRHSSLFIDLKEAIKKDDEMKEIIEEDDENASSLDNTSDDGAQQETTRPTPVDPEETRSIGPFTSRRSEDSLAEPPSQPSSAPGRGESSDRPGLYQGPSFLTLSVNRFNEWRKNRQQFSDDHRNSHDVFHQALWYLGAFLMTHFFSTINRAIQLASGKTYFPLLVLHSFFDPLQGFLNFVVYRRPRYLRARRKGPDVSRIKAAALALHWSRAFVEKDGTAHRSRAPGSSSADVQRTQNVSSSGNDDCPAEQEKEEL